MTTGTGMGSAIPTGGSTARSCARGPGCVRSASLAVLAVTTALQIVVFVLSGIGGAARRPHPQLRRCALTACRCGIAFLLRSSARSGRPGCSSSWRSSSAPASRASKPSSGSSTPVAPGASVATRDRRRRRLRRQLDRRSDPTRAGRRLDSPALIADGNHARADAYVSLAVVASAIVVALGFTDRRPAHRPRDHPGHPAHHLAELEHRPWSRASPSLAAIREPRLEPEATTGIEPV